MDSLALEKCCRRKKVPIPDHPNMENRIYIIISIVIVIQSVKCIEFHRDYTGVVFSPYVKKAEGIQPIPSFSDYKIEEVKTMLEVVSTKFTRVLTETMHAYNNVTYHANSSYYQDTYIASRIAEAAALINLYRNSRNLTVFLGVWDRWSEDGNGIRTNTEVNVASEAAHIANGIFPGTVEGFVFTKYWIPDPDWGIRTLQYLRQLRNMTSNLKLKIGVLQLCDKFQDMEDEEDEVRESRTAVLMEIDFVICKFRMGQNSSVFGANYTIPIFTRLLMRWKSGIKKINENLVVMGQTNWASAGDETYQNPQNLKDYWLDIDQFAASNNFYMWLQEAFDNPWKVIQDEPYQENFGWWKLERNALAGKVEGYKEKIEKEKRIPSGNPNSWFMIAGGSVIGIGLIILIVGGLWFNTYRQLRSLKQILTKEEIKEFRFGNKEADTQGLYGSALQMPYDKLLEIPKDKLEIYWDQILGTGQFGRVHKARLDDKEVALKMTKKDCPATALKGILSEIKILAYLGQHPNIVSILGAYTAALEKCKVYLAIQLCSLGSLRSYLISFQKSGENSKESISFDDMIRWSHEIACGMEYLQEKEVVHADLACRNVLLSEDKTAKITDFGLSRRLYDYTKYVKQQQEPLPWRWMAIESLKILEFSTKSDVWSYGVTLWEIFSLGDLPFPGLSWNLDFVGELENGLRMKKPNLATDDMYKIMLGCWQENPEERTSFTELKYWTRELCNKDLYTVLHDK